MISFCSNPTHYAWNHGQRVRDATQLPPKSPAVVRTPSAIKLQSALAFGFCSLLSGNQLCIEASEETTRTFPDNSDRTSHVLRPDHVWVRIAWTSGGK
jgi:hypothetical protein